MDNMYLFDSYKIETQPGHVRLSAEMTVQFEDANEECAFGTPKWWDDRILQALPIDRYRSLFICTQTVPSEKVSRISDYKHVWGLKSMPHGDFADAYTTDAGKVYFGIIEAEFSSGLSGTVLLVEKGHEVAYRDIFEVFKRCRYDFKQPDDAALRQVSVLAEGLILLKYDIHKVSLDIYGKSVEPLFSGVDLMQYENREDEPVFKRQ